MLYERRPASNSVRALAARSLRSKQKPANPQDGGLSEHNLFGGISRLHDHACTDLEATQVQEGTIAENFDMLLLP